MMPQAIVFDLDETLARSKEPITEAMAERLTLLLAHTYVAVASGGKLEQLEKQVADRLPPSADRSRLFLLPTNGAALYAFSDTWTPLYEETIPESEVPRIRAAIEEAIRSTRTIDLSLPSHGERIEYRRSQVTLSALGQQAPIDEKGAWDPDRSKRRALQEAIAARLPDFDVRQGGSTSVDVIRRGVSKAYGVRKLAEHLGSAITSMLYVGDALFPGGNDEVVKETGIQTREVSGPEETLALIDELIASIMKV